MEVHGSCLEVCFSIQPQGNTSQGTNGEILWMPYDEYEVHPDSEKIDAIHALSTPTNIPELQEFLGMVTYLSLFIPGLSTLTAPQHELLKKDAEFSWDASYQTAFHHDKDAVVSDTTL